MSDIKIYTPQAGGQEAFVRANADIVIFGGVLGCAKTAGAILANAEPSLDPEYRAAFFRRTFGELKSAGGVLDEFSKFYGDNVSITKSENPRITFKNSGAWVECRQIADENRDKVRETFKGAQYSAVFFEELTGFQFYTWNYLGSRCRSQASWTGKIRATTNPSKKHWVRKMLDWYIGADGYAIKERSGVIRYCYLDGDSVEDYVWGDTKAEVYRKCKKSIDEKLMSLNDDSITYENLIKSFTFILGNLAENKALLESNPDYVGNVSGAEGDALLKGNWNYDPSEELDLPISINMAHKVTEVNPATNGCKWVSVDLADTGTNATVIAVFDGLHWIDAQILNVSTPKQNAEWIMKMARKHGIAYSHILYDAQRAAYMLDYIPEAVPYYSFSPARGILKRVYKRRKDENYGRLIEAINRGAFSMSPDVAEIVFERTKYGPVTIFQKFIQECKAVGWKDDTLDGKKRLLGKTEMNRQLGTGESMDLLDAAHQIMSVYEQVEFGMELDYGRRMLSEDEENMKSENYCNIYEDSTWF